MMETFIVTTTVVQYSWLGYRTELTNGLSELSWSIHKHKMNWGQSGIVDSIYQ
jgi:hypothetical protein